MKSWLIFIFIFVLPWQVYGQYEEYIQKDPAPTHRPQTGVNFSVLESGTGIGAFYKYPINIAYMHVGASFNIHMLRDRNQVDFYDPYYGGPVSINKKNNVYLLDLMFSLKKRFFADKVDDSLRPFLSVSAGPLYGMNFPENDRFEDQFDFIMSGAVAAGVDAVFSDQYLFGISIQYRFMRFHEEIGERKNQSSVNLSISMGKQL